LLISKLLISKLLISKLLISKLLISKLLICDDVGEAKYKLPIFAVFVARQESTYHMYDAYSYDILAVRYAAYNTYVFFSFTRMTYAYDIQAAPLNEKGNIPFSPFR
jgi:hypothetical protein